MVSWRKKDILENWDISPVLINKVFIKTEKYLNSSFCRLLVLIASWDQASRRDSKSKYWLTKSQPIGSGGQFQRVGKLDGDERLPTMECVFSSSNKDPEMKLLDYMSIPFLVF